MEEAQEDQEMRIEETPKGANFHHIEKHKFILPKSWNVNWLYPVKYLWEFMKSERKEKEEERTNQIVLFISKPYPTELY